MTPLGDWAAGLELELSIRFSGSTWTEVTTYVRALDTDISASRALSSSFPPGRASFTLDNRDGRFTPLYASGPHFGNIFPGRHIRLKAKYGATTYDVWYGVIEDWGDASPQARDGLATITAVQSSALLARSRGAAGSPVVGAGEFAGERVSRVLTARGWTLGSTIGASAVPLIGSDLTKDGLSEINDAVEAEFGAFWCEPNGTVVFEGRNALATQSRSNTSQATFGPGGGEIPYLADPEPELSSGLDLVVNDATRSNVGGQTWTAQNSSSISSLGGTFSDSVLNMIGELDAYSLANAVAVTTYLGMPYQHPRSISVRPISAPSTCFPQVFGRRIRDRVTIKVPTAQGTTHSIPCWLVGISHRGVPGDWVTTLTFDPATALNGVAWNVWGTGVWGTATWAP
jgi:hypothetical protein